MLIDTSKGKLPVRYGWNALAKFGDMVNMTMDEVLEMDLTKMKMSDIMTFILVGFLEGARKDGCECRVNTVEDVGDLIDDDPGVISLVISAFSEMSRSPVDAEPAKKK